MMMFAQWDSINSTIGTMQGVALDNTWLPVTDNRGEEYSFNTHRTIATLASDENSIILTSEIRGTDYTGKNRAKRESLLYDSDWTQMADSPLTDSKKAEWRIYRQALRDLPTHSIWPELEGSDWPTPPT